MDTWVLVLGVALALSASDVAAQPNPPSPHTGNEEVQVRETIEVVFDAMRAGDSAALRSVFHPRARLQTVLAPSDTSTVRATSVEAFADAVGQSREKVWDERIWDVEIRVDGPLASAWVPYVFYLGDQRSHCGVNAIHLVKTANGWQILQGSDTRRQACDVPPEARK